jgi:hypothetical protein
MSATEVPDREFAKFLTPERVIELRGEDGTVLFILERLLFGHSQELAGLMIAERCRLPFVCLGLRPFHALCLRSLGLRWISRRER